VPQGVIPILRTRRALLVTVHVDLNDAVAEALQEDILGAIDKTSAKGVIIDISGLDSVDSYVARVLADTGRMTQLLGAVTIIVGMRPEVAATLVRMGYGMGGVQTALDVDEGLLLLKKLQRKTQR
jgi:rsbT antagonist protein RsbS